MIGAKIKFSQRTNWSVRRLDVYNLAFVGIGIFSHNGYAVIWSNEQASASAKVQNHSVVTSNLEEWKVSTEHAIIAENYSLIEKRSFVQQRLYLKRTEIIVLLFLSIKTESSLNAGILLTQYANSVFLLPQFKPTEPDYQERRKISDRDVL